LIGGGNEHQRFFGGTTAVAAIAFAAPSPGAAPLLTEAEIKPCEELLSYRGHLYNESTEKSNMEVALSSPPFSPLYDLKDVREFLVENGKSIAAMESGSEAAQRAQFGIVYKGQDATDRLMSDRLFQCMLNVRLRQLQHPARKK
jgi:hypothetical protein